MSPPIPQVQRFEEECTLHCHLKGEAVHHLTVVTALLYSATGALDRSHNMVLPLSWPSDTPFGGAAILGTAAAQDATYVLHTCNHAQTRTSLHHTAPPCRAAPHSSPRLPHMSTNANMHMRTRAHSYMCAHAYRYVHAMLHRQEGDFVGQEGGGTLGWDNAEFWFSRVAF